jgi:group 4 capsule polysaccharide lipoprotein GfcB/YjbF
MKHSARAGLLMAVAALCACNSGMNAVVQTLRGAVHAEDASAGARLDPAFRYLRVTTDSRVALLALGYVERDPRGPVEVWYSARREVLRLQNGRLVGAVGLPTEWRGVSLPQLPAWSAVARGERPLRWVRVRDVMPGYRFGIRDALAVRAIAPPAKSALEGLDPQRLVWFEERLEPPGADEFALPPARYAVDAGEVVYGEQCLAPDFCFTWQRWPAQRAGR